MESYHAVTVGKRDRHRGLAVVISRRDRANEHLLTLTEFPREFLERNRPPT
jgi:hypothetical protein